MKVYFVVLLRKSTQSYLQLDLRATNKAHAYYRCMEEYSGWCVLGVNQIIESR